MKTLPSHVRTRGHTLVELMVVLLLLAILVAVAIPSFKGMIRSIRLASASNDMVAGLLAARSEAAKRRVRVALCKSHDALQCATEGGWEQGWIVFHDTNNDGLRQSSEPVLQRVEPLPSGWRVQGNQNVARYISYDPPGGTQMVSGAFQAGTITICPVSSGPTEARQLVINATGRPRVQKVTVPSCP